MEESQAAVAAYATKRVEFRFRSATMDLALSHGLFSSADVDAGTRFLLRVLSRAWDEDISAGRRLPSTVLDAGCGVGVIGIAAAKALGAAGVRDARVRCQDRDELAAAFSAENARANGIGPDVLRAYAEPLLAGPAGARWDLILSNVPAKAGGPVLADFFARSAASLAPDGRAFAVIVLPLADAAREWIGVAAEILGEERGADHAVFAYRRRAASDAPPGAEADRSGAGIDVLAAPEGPIVLPSRSYGRAAMEHSIEESSFRIESVHGVADFDTASRAVVLAAKLCAKIGAPLPGFDAAPRDRVPSALVHECGQGHFPAWLASRAGAAGGAPPRIVLAGRNVLALAAAAENTRAASGARSAAGVRTAAVVDLGIAADRLLADSGPFDLVASFPDPVPRVDRAGDTWLAAEKLLAPGGLLLVAQSSTEAERFDRVKRKGFSRAGELKRDGFCARAYRRG